MAFEALLSRGDQKPARWRRMMLTVSLAAHGTALLAGVLHSLWQVEEMPMPSVDVTLARAVPPPPPPPPPPAGKKASVERTKPKQVAVKEELVEPSEATPEPAETSQSEESGSEDAEPGGEAGGVPGGVPGGVVGGVVGGKKPPPPATRARKKPKIVSGGVGRQQLLIDPNVDPYRVNVPRSLARTGGEFHAFVRVCVSATGRVTHVGIVKGAGPAIDSQIPTVIRRWRYRPLTIDGQPTPFCYPLNYRIR